MGYGLRFFMGYELVLLMGYRLGFLKGYEFGKLSIRMPPSTLILYQHQE